MLDFGFYNMDCMDGMKEFPDKYFDLAIVDPPYGINVGHTVMVGKGGADRPFKGNYSHVWGDSTKALAKQNFIIPSMTATRQTKGISESLKGFQSRG